MKMSEERFDFLVRQAAREVAEKETQEIIDMCASLPPFTTSPDYAARIAGILASSQTQGKARS